MNNQRFKLNAVKAVIFLSMLNNLPHAANLYHLSYEGFKIGSVWDLFTQTGIQSLMVVAVIDLTLIILVNYGHKKEDARTAAVFAWILFVVNVLVGDVVHDVFNYAYTFFDPTLLTKLLGKILFSGIFSFTLHYFSYLHVRLVTEEQERATQNQELADIKQEQSKLQALLEQLKTKESAWVEFNKSVDQFKEEAAHYKKLYETDLLKRTFFKADGTSELCESIKAVNGRMNGLGDAEKEHHYREQKLSISKLELIIKP
jgi:hypothetical protein